jgi:ribosomal protein L19E
MSECCAMCSMFSCDCGPEAECQKDAYRWESYRELKSQLAAAQAEVTRLSGKTGFCTQCERYAKEVDGLRESLKEWRLDFMNVAIQRDRYKSAYLRSKGNRNDQLDKF